MLTSIDFPASADTTIQHVVDGMIYGAPAGSMGLMAYDFEFNGNDGQGSRNVERLILAIVLGGLGLGALALRRRGTPLLPKA